MSLLKLTQRSQFPACLQPIEQVEGICVGRCVDRQKGDAKLATRIINPNQQIAHVHVHTITYHGWICLAWKFLLKEERVLLHEAAHLIAPSHSGHGKEWRKALVAIGGTYKAYEINFRDYVIPILDYTYTRL
jgi:hypothetical protein